MSFLSLHWGLILAQVNNPNPGQAASTITEDGVAASSAVAQSMDKLWNDVLGGGLYGAIAKRCCKQIANLGIFFAVGTLLIFMVQWTREMVDGDNSKAISSIRKANSRNSFTKQQCQTFITSNSWHTDYYQSNKSNTFRNYICFYWVTGSLSKSNAQEWFF
ncbi:MAG: hypothetical protein WBA39_34670 [Rivularia sp. (in: cyanobacteria)]